MRLQDIINRIPTEPDKPRLVSGLCFELQQKIDSIRARPTIVILTDRRLSLNGGNGRDGVDGIDMNNIRTAILGVMRSGRGNGFVSEFIVRERRHYPPGTYEGI